MSRSQPTRPARSPVSGRTLCVWLAVACMAAGRAAAAQEAAAELPDADSSAPAPATALRWQGPSSWRHCGGAATWVYFRQHGHRLLARRYRHAGPWRLRQPAPAVGAGPSRCHGHRPADPRAGPAGGSRCWPVPFCRTMEHARLMLGPASPRNEIRVVQAGDYPGLKRLLAAHRACWHQPLDRGPRHPVSIGGRAFRIWRKGRPRSFNRARRRAAPKPARISARDRLMDPPDEGLSIHRARRAGRYWPGCPWRTGRRWPSGEVLPSRRLRVALVGAMVPLHLRLMDCCKSVPLRPMARTAVPGARCLVRGAVAGCHHGRALDRLSLIRLPASRGRFKRPVDCPRRRS